MKIQLILGLSVGLFIQACSKEQGADASAPFVIDAGTYRAVAQTLFETADCSGPSTDVTETLASPVLVVRAAHTFTATFVECVNPKIDKGGQGAPTRLGSESECNKAGGDWRVDSRKGTWLQDDTTLTFTTDPIFIVCDVSSNSKFKCQAQERTEVVNPDGKTTTVDVDCLEIEFEMNS